MGPRVIRVRVDLVDRQIDDLVADLSTLTCFGSLSGGEIFMLPVLKIEIRPRFAYLARVEIELIPGKKIEPSSIWTSSTDTSFGSV